jgi:methyl-accepting chemotaxis protein
MSASVTVGGVPARPVRTYSFEELATRTDALALAIGSKATASVIMLACVAVILIGAQSLLGQMESMNRDLKSMNEQMAIANGGLTMLNKTMDSVPLTSAHLKAITATVADTSHQVKVSNKAIGEMEVTTAKLHQKVGSIATSTTRMRGSLETASKGTDTLSTTIDSLNGDIQPLVRTQHQMLGGTRTMRDRIDGMNSSLAYTVRIMNFIAQPPTGGGMTIEAELPKSTLPPIPGLKATVDPLNVFPRNVWPVYHGR